MNCVKLLPNSSRASTLCTPFGPLRSKESNSFGTGNWAGARGSGLEHSFAKMFISRWTLVPDAMTIFNATYSPRLRWVSLDQRLVQKTDISSLASHTVANVPLPSLRSMQYRSFNTSPRWTGWYPPTTYFSTCSALPGGLTNRAVVMSSLSMLAFKRKHSLSAMQSREWRQHGGKITMQRVVWWNLRWDMHFLCVYVIISYISAAYSQKRKEKWDKSRVNLTTMEIWTSIRG